MPVYPLKWHQTNLENHRSYNTRTRLTLESELRSLERSEREVKWEEDRIANAINMGKEGFDPDLFYRKTRKDFDL